MILCWHNTVFIALAHLQCRSLDGLLLQGWISVQPVEMVQMSLQLAQLYSKKELQAQKRAKLVSRDVQNILLFVQTQDVVKGSIGT